MKVKSFGCSFVYGTDLSDTQNNNENSRLTWPALLADRFHLPYKCFAGGGHGNLSILDRLTKQILLDPESLFVIQWTYIDRYDYSDPQGRHFDQGLNDFLTLRPGDQSIQAEYYFRHLHSEYRDKLSTLIYIKTALDLLKEKNCKFLMTCLDSLVWSNVYHSSPALEHWQKDIIPELNFFEGMDFLTWSQSKNFAMGKTGHPTDDAHHAACDLLCPVIDAILHKA